MLLGSLLRERNCSLPRSTGLDEDRQGFSYTIRRPRGKDSPISRWPLNESRKRVTHYSGYVQNWYTFSPEMMTPTSTAGSIALLVFEIFAWFFVWWLVTSIAIAYSRTNALSWLKPALRFFFVGMTKKAELGTMKICVVKCVTIRVHL